MVWIKIEPVWVLSFLQRSGKPNKEVILCITTI
nr:MAG TPA: protein of unknown function (DUF4291) [Caudoviricetes sp.]DAW85422.1 MAG TPA: protein of unknown function (DUF4291) [Bacteriophage sp.]